MKSKTSFFNTSLLRKDVVRFAPAWVLYTVALVLVFSGSILSYDRRSVAYALSESIGLFGVFNLGYAMLCAQLLFGDLFQSRMCNALHALPIRRESWFVTHLLAGLAFCAIPVAAAGLVFLAVLGSYWMAALLWMAALMLQFLFFFAVAILSVMLVGSRFAAAVVYAILSFLAAIMLWLFTYLYQPHLYGFVIDTAPFLQFCPVVQLFLYGWFSPNKATGLVYLKDGWGYLGICALVAVAFLALGLWLYRRRALEKAGDFIVFMPTAPVFLVLYTFSAGTALHLFSRIFVGESTEFVFLIVGLAIGFFTGLMLLERTIRVFRGKTFARFGILLAAFGLTLILTILDPVGITRWVPDSGDVKWVALETFSEYDHEEHGITDKEIIKQVLSAHPHAVDHPEEANNGERDVTIMFTYRMKSGRTVQRQFMIDTDTLAAMTLKSVLSRPEVLFGNQYMTADDLAKELRYIELTTDDSMMITDQEQMRGLVEAVIADSLAGNLCQDYMLRNKTGEGYIYMDGGMVTHPEGYDYTKGWHINFSKEATNIQKWLKENID